MPRSIEVSARQQALGYLYAVWWMYKFYLRQNIVGKVARYLLILLFAIEILGPMTHLVPISSQGKGQYWLTAGLLACAGTLIWHHTRLNKRVERHNVVLSSTVVLLEEQSRNDAHHRRGAMRAKTDVRHILDAYTFALEDYYPDNTFAASVLVREAGEDRFKIYAQDFRDQFHNETTLHHLNSVAGAVANEDHGTLLYVPRTSCIHALRIAAEESDVGKRRYRTARIIPNAFQMLDCDPPVLRSLLCIRVPLNDPARFAVLSFSSAHADGLGDLEFHAVKVAASLIGRAVG